MNDVKGRKVGAVGKSENSETDKDKKDQGEEKLCKSIIKDLRGAQM